VVVAYYAITHGEPGVAVVAGTGSIAYGRNERGDEVRVGGWGWLVGDEGSAFDIARRAINAAFRSYDGRGPSTSLTDAVKRRFNVKDLRDLITYLYAGRGTPVARIARLAPLVNAAAVRGDEVARRILNEAGEELASAVIAAVRRLGMAGRSVVVGGVGGVFRSRFVTNSFRRKLFSERAFRPILRGPLYGPYPALGGLILALKERGALREGVAEKYFKSLSAKVRAGA